jgi:hypothetical protein
MYSGRPAARNTPRAEPPREFSQVQRSTDCRAAQETGTERSAATRALTRTDHPLASATDPLTEFLAGRHITVMNSGWTDILEAAMPDCRHVVLQDSSPSPVYSPKPSSLRRSPKASEASSPRPPALIAPAGLEQMFGEIAPLSEGEQKDPSMLGGIAARFGVRAFGSHRLQEERMDGFQHGHVAPAAAATRQPTAERWLASAAAGGGASMKFGKIETLPRGDALRWSR